VAFETPARRDTSLIVDIFFPWQKPGFLRQIFIKNRSDDNRLKYIRFPKSWKPIFRFVSVVRISPEKL